MRAKGGDLMAKSIPSVGGLIEYLCSEVGMFAFFLAERLGPSFSVFT